jgi:hypothetical protein
MSNHYKGVLFGNIICNDRIVDQYPLGRKSEKPKETQKLDLEIIENLR